MKARPTSRHRIRSGEPTYHEILDFLYDEAAMLDERRHDEWLRLLDPEVRYLVPVRLTTAHDLATSTSTMAHFDEDLYSLSKRVERFTTEHAWAEDPPSRTRRFVTNLMCWQAEREGLIIARTSLLLFRSRGDVREPDLLSASRDDVINLTSDGPRLLRREVWLDEAVLRTQNLAIFL